MKKAHVPQIHEPGMTFRHMENKHYIKYIIRVAKSQDGRGDCLIFITLILRVRELVWGINIAGINKNAGENGIWCTRGRRRLTVGSTEK